MAAAMLLAGGVVASGATAAPDTAGKTTVEQTIKGPPRPEAQFPQGNLTGRGYFTLSLGPGESYVLREEGVGRAASGRAARRQSLVYFGQFTDFQLADEESPGRLDGSETFHPSDDPKDPSGADAVRPQHTLIPHMVEMGVRQMNLFADASPIRQGNRRRARMRFVIATGDSADSPSVNETEWVVRLLEGGTLDPNSGSSDPDDYQACPPGTPGTEEAARYTGIQDYDDYFESPDYYDPDKPLGELYGDWPRYPGLLDRAQIPFAAEGLEVPSYVVFGNHDGLIQGNEDAVQPLELVAIGCIKSTQQFPSGGQLSAVLNPDFLQSQLESSPSNVMLVPPDPRRRFVDKPQYKRLHFTGKQPDGHGFGLIDSDEERASRGAAGYYAWDAAPGFRFIALDTLSEGGVIGASAEGNIDDPQFKWLEDELRRARRDDKLVVLFGHHSIRKMIAGVPDELAAPCTVPDSHGHDVNPGCDLDPRQSLPLHLGPGEISDEEVDVEIGENVRELFLRYPNVIAHVSGHTHENLVRAFPQEGGGGFWGIETASEADWPIQNRVIEVMNNCDGTLSIFGTVLDVAAPVGTPAFGTPAGGLGTEELAALGRTYAFNDPQVGGGVLEGQSKDRNVELLVEDPRKVGGGLRVSVSPRRATVGRRTRFRFRVTSTPGSARPLAGASIRFAGRVLRSNRDGRASIVATLRRARRYRAVASRAALCSDATRVRAARRKRPAGEEEQRRSDDARASGRGGDLPFTGYALIPLAVLGVLLALAGLLGRRRLFR